MDDPKKMGYRSTGISGVTSGASTRTPYSAMDLHTTTASNPRRMYTSPSSTSIPSADVARMKAEDAGLSARGILIRRKLTERKRFDSADYAMKNAVNPSIKEETNTTKWTGTNQGKMGASVFLNALNDGDVEMTSYENEAVTTTSKISSPMASTSTKYRNYGTLSTPTVSGHSVLIQKKLQDRRQVNSADYQLARQRQAVPSPSERSPSPLPMETSEDEDMNLSSPSASTTRDFTHAYTHMSPSATVRTTNMNKYAGLSGASEVARRRIAEKKRFDSADEFMAVPNTKPMTQADRFLQRQQTGGNPPPQRGTNEYSSRNVAYPSTPAMSGVTAPPAPTQVEATASPGGSKYGKLCAANVLIRKKLKERKRFDSADYNMERAAAEGKEQDHAESQPSAAFIPPAAFTPPAARWSSITAPQPKAFKRIDESKPVVNDVSSQESRLMARNVMLHKKLAERKRFDSADFFSAQEAAKRGHLAA